MTVRRVLLTSGGTGVGNAVLTALRSSVHPYHVTTTNAEPFHSGVFRADHACLAPSSESEPARWAELVLSVVEQQQVRLVVPCRDYDVFALAGLRQELHRLGAIAACPDDAIAGACLDKIATCAWLARLGLPVAKTAVVSNSKAVGRVIDAHGFPVIVKPRRGTGTVGVRLIDCSDTLTAFISQLGDHACEWIVQEYLPIEGPAHSVTKYTPLAQDKEYSIQLLFDASGGVVTWMATINTLENGLPVAARYDRSIAVEESVTRLPRPFTGMVGPLNLQGRRRGDKIVFFEANARCTGLTGSRTRFGLNEPDVLWDTLVECRSTPEIVYRSDLCIYRQLEDTALALDDLRTLMETGQWKR